MKAKEYEKVLLQEFVEIQSFSSQIGKEDMSLKEIYLDNLCYGEDRERENAVYLCPNCNKVFLVCDIPIYTEEKKCPRCGNITGFSTGEYKRETFGNFPG